MSFKSSNTRSLISKSSQYGPGSTTDISGPSVNTTTIVFVMVLVKQSEIGVPSTVYDVVSVGETIIIGPSTGAPGSNGSDVHTQS